MVVMFKRDKQREPARESRRERGHSLPQRAQDNAKTDELAVRASIVAMKPGSINRSSEGR